MPDDAAVVEAALTTIGEIVSRAARQGNAALRERDGSAAHIECFGDYEGCLRAMLATGQDSLKAMALMKEAPYAVAREELGRPYTWSNTMWVFCFCFPKAVFGIGVKCRV